jgi:S-adenosylmethionine:tRNA ribosyltransferase-isomerase
VRTDELLFDLPPELIASTPLAERDASRLLVLRRSDGSLTDDAIRSLPALLPEGALLVVNDTRVIPARLRGVKPSGGKAEFLLVRARSAEGRRWEALGRASKPMRDGVVIEIGEGLAVRILGRDGMMLDVELLADDPWAAIERHGEMPLPPYMHRAPDESDRERYQTVYADRPGAVAAPTAGLHLTEALFDAMRARGIERVPVTLHVGPGTFAPVMVDDLDEHPMHTEWYDVPEATAAAVREAKCTGRPVVAVGTTVVRTLESWALGEARTGETRLLIQPGYAFRVVDALLTNFHLPRSTLLALVMAFGGVEPVRAAYAMAVASRYRFFSYGDAMLVL